VASRYLLSLRLINDEAESHDSRTIIEGNLAFLSRGNYYDYHYVIVVAELQGGEAWGR
jgi:hypothetical protein